MLAIVKPSPLRLWGFVFTVLGGALIALGSIGDWAAISLGNSVEDAVPTKGLDVWQGKATLLLGVLIIVAILVLRFVRANRRATVAIGIIVMGTLALGLTAWSAASLASVAGDAGIAALTKTAEHAGMSAADASQLIAGLLDRFGIQMEARSGLWIAIAGSVLAVLGGIVDLWWVRRKRAVGDTIDPDTLAEETAAV